MAETVVAPTYARFCVVGRAGTSGGLRETVRLMNDGNSMRPVADVLGDLNDMVWDAFPKEWRKAYDRRRYKAEALARIKRNRDRKSTRLNSSHLGISYAVFCLKTKQ